MLCFKFAGLLGNVIGESVLPIWDECWWKVKNKEVIEVGFAGSKIDISIKQINPPIVLFYDVSDFELKISNTINYYDIIIRKDVEILLLIFWDLFHSVPVILENPKFESMGLMESVNRPLFNIDFNSFKTIHDYLKPELLIGNSKVELINSGLQTIQILPPTFIKLLDNPFTKNLLKHNPIHDYLNCKILINAVKIDKNEFLFEPNTMYFINLIIGQQELELPEGIFNLGWHFYQRISQ